jgi:hypothetical protein
VTFDSAKKSDIQFIRAALIAKIKLAQNYKGSKMQAAIEAYEEDSGGAEAASGGSDDGDEDETPAPVAKPKAKAAAPKKPPAPKPPVSVFDMDDLDDDVPFATASMFYDMTTSKARKMARYDY